MNYLDALASARNIPRFAPCKATVLAYKKGTASPDKAVLCFAAMQLY